MLEPLLPRLKREIEARLAELRTVVAEAEQLEAAKEAMLAEAAAVSAAADRRARAARAPESFRAELRSGAASSPLATAPRPSPRSDGAPARAAIDDERGATQTAILEIVEERPGVSIAEITSVTRIAPPLVAATVSRLKREGVLADEAGGVKLASRQPVTLSQFAAPTGGADATRSSTRGEGVSDEEWEAAARRNPAVA